MCIKMVSWKTLFLGLTIFLILPGSASAETLVFDGIEFPHGEKSFGDSVVSFRLDDPGIGEEYSNPEAALGPPDYNTVETPTFVSLGNAVEGEPPGEIVLAFDSNRLVDVEGDDLYIFEIGPAVEATNVAISIDGETWYEIGKIEGATRGVDLADYPNVPDRRGFRYVRLQDFPDGSTSPAPAPGPDIDAIGAIGSVDASEIAEDGRFLSDIEAGGDDGCSATGSPKRIQNASLVLIMLGLIALLVNRNRTLRLVTRRQK